MAGEFATGGVVQPDAFVLPGEHDLCRGYVIPTPAQRNRSRELLRRRKPMLRRFVLRRVEDETGVSGTGDVASGVLWPDGKAAMRWHPVDMTAEQATSTAVYDSIEAVERIHGHGGKTRIVWLDQEAS